MENWRNFVKEAAGDIDSDGDMDPHDVAKLAAKVAAQSTGTSREQLMAMISDRIRETGASSENSPERREISTQEDFDYAKEELCDENSNLCGDIMSITYEEFLYFEENKQQKSDRENYNLASSVMQNDDSISLQKKIPSGLD